MKNKEYYWATLRQHQGQIVERCYPQLYGAAEGERGNLPRTFYLTVDHSDGTWAAFCGNKYVIGKGDVPKPLDLLEQIRNHRNHFRASYSTSNGTRNAEPFVYSSLASAVHGIREIARGEMTAGESATWRILDDYGIIVKEGIIRP